jgi:AraC-like DNA-binding protein
MSKRQGPPPHHNTLTCFKDYGCRLPACHQRYLDYQRESYRRRKEGRVNLIDAGPVRLHIHDLYEADFTDHRIAKLAGTSPATVHAIAVGRKGRGRQHRINPGLAERILAITPDTARPGRVSAVGAHRRIRALVAAGWPMHRIAAEAGLNEQNLHRLFHQKTIKISTDRALATTYDKLRELRPDRSGVRLSSVRRSRNQGRARQWQTISYWDHPDHPINDPDFEPKTAIQETADEARWLMDVGGLDVQQAAVRLRRSHSYVSNCLREYPAADELVAA